MRIEYARPVNQGVTSAMAIGEDTSLEAATRAFAQESMKPWRLAVTGAMAYHGYRRNRSVGWAFGWAIFGNMFPIISSAVALAQGFGQRK